MEDILPTLAFYRSMFILDTDTVTHRFGFACRNCFLCTAITCLLYICYVKAVKYRD